MPTDKALYKPRKQSSTVKGKVQIAIEASRKGVKRKVLMVSAAASGANCWWIICFVESSACTRQSRLKPFASKGTPTTHEICSDKKGCICHAVRMSACHKDNLFAAHFWILQDKQCVQLVSLQCKLQMCISGLVRNTWRCVCVCVWSNNECFV